MHTSRVICFVTASRFITSEIFLTVKRREWGGAGQQTGTSTVKHKLFFSFNLEKSIQDPV
jgi:hypothetical protein